MKESVNSISEKQCIACFRYHHISKSKWSYRRNDKADQCSDGKPNNGFFFFFFSDINNKDPSECIGKKNKEGGKNDGKKCISLEGKCEQHTRRCELNTP